MKLRRLQATAGGATFIVSLPKAWTERLGLKPGEYLGIDERPDGSLVVRPERAEKPRRIERSVDFETAGRDLAIREIVAHYISGADSIALKGAGLDWEAQKGISDTARRLLPGVEVTDEAEGRVVFSVVLAPGELTPQKVLQRAYSVADWMFENAVTGMTKPDEILCRDVIERDYEVDRLTLLAARQLTKAVSSPEFLDSLGMGLDEAMYYRLLFANVELLADLAVDVARQGIDLQGKRVPPALLESVSTYSAEARELFEKSMKSFTARDAKLASRVIEKCNRLSAEGLPELGKEILTRKGEPETVAVLARTVSSLSIAVAIAKGIAEQNINRAATGVTR
jgi:AbrB family looped-hinge helix DNA binding protein